jgi:hypothetical protein
LCRDHPCCSVVLKALLKKSVNKWLSLLIPKARWAVSRILGLVDD